MGTSMFRCLKESGHKLVETVTGVFLLPPPGLSQVSFLTISPSVKPGAGEKEGKRVAGELEVNFPFVLIAPLSALAAGMGAPGLCYCFRGIVGCVRRVCARAANFLSHSYSVCFEQESLGSIGGRNIVFGNREAVFILFESMPHHGNRRLPTASQRGEEERASLPRALKPSDEPSWSLPSSMRLVPNHVPCEGRAQGSRLRRSRGDAIHS